MQLQTLWDQFCGVIGQPEAMTPSRSSHHQPMLPSIQTETFVDSLFSKRTGILVAAYGINGQSTPNGGYTFEGRLRNRCFEWPLERARFLTWASNSCDRFDVYLIPNLRRSRSAKVEFGKIGRYVWVDIDHVTDETRRLLDAVLSRGSLVVQSGGRGGLHVYIRLDGWYPRDVFQRLNQHLAGYIGGDSKYRDNSLLRLPGTLNHKGRAKGERSYPVILCDDDYDLEPWSPAALSEALGPLPIRPLKAKGSKPKKRGSVDSKSRRTLAPEVIPVEAESLPEHLPDEVARLVPFASKAKKIDRSAQLHGLVLVAMTHGYNDGEIMAIGLLSEPGQEKWPNRHDLQVEIQRCIDKLRPSHPYGNQSWARHLPLAGDLLTLLLTSGANGRVPQLSTDL